LDSSRSRFFNQALDTIDVNDGTSTLRDSYITGSGNEFTIWSVASDVVSPFDCRLVEVDVISGTVLPNGDLDARLGTVLVGWFGSECDFVASLIGVGSASNGLGVTIAMDFDAAYVSTP